MVYKALSHTSYQKTPQALCSQKALIKIFICRENRLVFGSKNEEPARENIWHEFFIKIKSPSCLPKLSVAVAVLIKNNKKTVLTIIIFHHNCPAKCIYASKSFNILICLFNDNSFSLSSKTSQRDERICALCHSL